MGYMEGAQELMRQLEAQEADMDNGSEPVNIEWRRIWHAVRAVWPDVLFVSIREWVTEGMRIAYALRTYRHCERRTVWKMLKGAAPAGSTALGIQRHTAAIDSCDHVKSINVARAARAGAACGSVAACCCPTCMVILKKDCPGHVCRPLEPSQQARPRAGPPQSALRKLCRRGVGSLPRNVWVFARGDSLSYAADATVRGFMLPWQLRHVLRNPGGLPQSEVAILCAKYTVVEVATVAVRLAATSVGAACTKLYRAAGRMERRHYGILQMSRDFCLPHNWLQYQQVCHCDSPLTPA